VRWEMPQPVYRHADAEILAAQATLTRFVTGFRRSHRGNLWQRWEGMSVTVFKRSDDLFAWCISTDSRTSYSNEQFETERGAIESLCCELID
jgi:hypothetical protein